MKFICDGEDLKSAVAIVAHGTNSKTVNQILEGIKIVAEGNKLEISVLHGTVLQTNNYVVKDKGNAVLIEASCSLNNLN